MGSFFSFLSSSITFALSILCFCSLVYCQQSYQGIAPGSCTHTDNSYLGYSCNSPNRSCETYLIFRSQPPYTNVAAISGLLSSDPTQLSQINSVPITANFSINQMVIVPVSCSCSGNYSQSNTSYVIQPGQYYFLIANGTFQGLASCEALQRQDGFRSTLFPGMRVNVPLRCACPTRNQTSAGIKYLLTYLIARGDDFAKISNRFGVDDETILEANEISSDTTIYEATTLLIPLKNPPNSSQTFKPPPPPPPSPDSAPPLPSPPSGNGSNKTWIYVLVGVIGGIVLILISGSVVYFVFFRGPVKRNFDSTTASDKFRAFEKPSAKKSEEDPEDFLESLQSVAKSVKVYKFEDLQSATDNFSPNCWIRGSVYRGTINGDLAAIKKMNGDVSKEIAFLNKINHLNLIRLSGVCFNDGNWYLVFEYAFNGSLSDWIFNKNSDRKYLNWTQRIQIVLDVATGLNYLHSFTNPPHVHMDINTSNVLLDGDFKAKIANFAQARSPKGHEGQFTLTRHIIGTRGYMAPEYLEHGLISTKLDVYALGVLMLEVLSGKEVAVLCGEENTDLSGFLDTMLQEKKEDVFLENLMDSSMEGNYQAELAVFVIKLINSCLKNNPAARPTMEEIVHSLSKILIASQNSEPSSNSSLRSNQGDM